MLPPIPHFGRQPAQGTGAGDVTSAISLGLRRWRYRTCCRFDQDQTFDEVGATRLEAMEVASGEW